MLRKSYKNIVIIGIFIGCLFQLNGCSFIGKPGAGKDGPPHCYVDISRIPDATPKVEPRSHYGNKDYKIGRHRYHVIKSTKNYSKVGYASWYGTKFHGHLTSSKERYDLYAMTAASPDLPLPTYVQVTNLSNNKKVVVKVNDRGPFAGHRIMDLSYAAAQKLGFANRGVAKVKIVALNPKSWHPDINSDDSNSINSNSIKPSLPLMSEPLVNKPGLYLQVGAFSQLASARHFLNQITPYTETPVVIDRREKMYRVQVGPFADTSQSDRVKEILAQHGYEKPIPIIV